MTVHIVTDSTCDLGNNLTARYRIHVVPLTVHLQGRTYYDGQDFTSADLFAAVESSGELPKTAAPAVPDFARFFELPGECVFIGISSKLSATVQNARLAADACTPGKVHIVDSLTLSSATGQLALKAADLRDQGLGAAEIAQQVRDLVPKMRVSFVIDTLKYLHMGGRCSALQSLIGGILKIRPIITAYPDGTLGVKDKVRGPRKRALDTMLADFEENLPQIDFQRVSVTHTGCDEDADYLVQAMRTRADIQEPLITRAGCVVSSHCGPGTIGVLYRLK